MKLSWGVALSGEGSGQLKLFIIMQPKALLLGFALLISVQTIGHYDFNACRISNCNAEELNCISEESGCLNSFGAMRNCFKTCQGVGENFNPCWKGCKNVGSLANAYWLSLSLCYENVCYLSGVWLVFGLGFLLLLFL